MRSTFGGLNTAVQGLYAQQIGLDTMGHNVTNINTEGYSRQTTNLVATRPQSMYGFYGSYQIGTGVDVASVLRTRDSFVDQQYWKQNSTLGYSNSMKSILGQIESVFSEPYDGGIQKVLDSFWNALQTLSTNASDVGARATVRARGQDVVTAVQDANKQLRNIIADNNSVIGIKVDKINQINSEIYSLNQQIRTVELGHTDHANDLRDRRDSLVNELSGLAGVSVKEDTAGNYVVQVDGAQLVDAHGYTKLAVQSTRDEDYGYEKAFVVIAGTTQAITFTNGEMKSLADIRDSREVGAKAYLDKLSTISKFMLTDFNAQHRLGYGMDDTTGNNFFGGPQMADGVNVNANPDYQQAAATGLNNALYGWRDNTKDWIDALCVNPELNTVDGLNKIAAKTASNGVADVAVKQTAGGDEGGLSVKASGAYTGGSAATKVEVKVVADPVNPAGRILQYRVNGGDFMEASIDDTKKPGAAKITVAGLDLDLALDDSATVGCAYSFDLTEKNSSVQRIIAYQVGSPTDAVTAELTGGTYSGDNSEVKFGIVIDEQGEPYATVDGERIKSPDLFNYDNTTSTYTATIHGIDFTGAIDKTKVSPGSMFELVLSGASSTVRELAVSSNNPTKSTMQAHATAGSIYAGAAGRSVTIKMTGQYAFTYTDKDGKEHTGAVVQSGADKNKSDVVIDGVKLTLEFDGKQAEGDQFTFTLSTTAANTSAPGDKPAFTQVATAAPDLDITSSGVYTDGTTSTDVVIEVTDPDTSPPQFTYTVDGVTKKLSWPTKKGDILIKGLELNIDLGDPAKLVKGSKYKIVLSYGNNANGDNAVNMSNSLKKDTSDVLGGATLDGYYSTVIADLGVQKQQMDRLSDNQQALVDQVVNWREAVSGVNLDEEMTSMIKYQQAYNASSKVVTVIDEMLDKLINGTGVVGR